MLGEEGALHVVSGGLDCIDHLLGKDILASELALRVAVLSGLGNRLRRDLAGLPFEDRHHALFYLAGGQRVN